MRVDSNTIPMRPQHFPLSTCFCIMCIGLSIQFLLLFKEITSNPPNAGLEHMTYQTPKSQEVHCARHTSCFTPALIVTLLRMMHQVLGYRNFRS